MRSNKASSVIFFGTPEFAIPSLRALVEFGFSVPLVVTAPDRPKGRGLQLTPPPIKNLALSLGLKVFQPEKLRDPKVINEILSYSPDVFVVVAYGRLIPSELFRAVPFGAVNVHPSLLPKYRGPAPIQRAILEGEEVTGVTIMLIDEGVDSGPVFDSRPIPIDPFETAGELEKRLAVEGADLLIKTLPKWLSGRISPLPQNDSEATFAPPIQKEETRIEWEKPAKIIINLCRAFDPTPGAYTIFQGKRVKCYGARRASVGFSEGMPGQVIGLSEEGLLVFAGDKKVVAIGALQMEGRRRLHAKEFVKGTQSIVGSRLGQ
ncbi:MAG: methionyl-tRNA formyltransferase [Syntrophobacterales bacterium]|nr:methionyl-tRNA formyltransferase [Syntrophobacterales bacterium]